MQFLWDKQNIVVENQYVASWFSYKQRVYTIKYVNSSNIANLPAETRYNAKH